MRIQDVMVHLLLKQPFYGYIAASVTPVECPDIAAVSMVTAPSLRLLYNKTWFEGLKEEHAVGTVIHELLHLVLLHPFRKGNREHQLWVIACDMAVNEQIDPSMLTADAVTVEKIAKELKEAIPPLKSAEFYYDTISKGEGSISLVENDNEIKVVLKSGQELKANNSTEGDSSEVSKNALKSMVSELVEQAREEGEIPSDICASIDEVYKPNEVNWRNVLKRFLSGKGRMQIRKTCKKESRRFEDLPGSKRIVGANVLLALDESGSMSDREIEKFYNELLAIKKITGAAIRITQFDTECTEPVPIENYIRNRGRIKNGGTDFRPVFQLADRLRIPLVMIFTDGDGTVPEEVNQRVLWILTKGGRQPSAFGHSIMYEV